MNGEENKNKEKNDNKLLIEKKIKEQKLEKDYMSGKYIIKD